MFYTFKKLKIKADTKVSSCGFTIRAQYCAPIYLVCCTVSQVNEVKYLSRHLSEHIFYEKKKLC